MSHPLFDSGWEGVISEAGLGVPLQSSLELEDGASKFVIAGQNPYNKEYQHKNWRSVSEEMAISTATAGFFKAIEKGFPRPGKKLFSLACTGSQKDKAGSQTHFWVAVKTLKHLYVTHVSMADSVRERANRIRATGEFLRKLLECIVTDTNPLDTSDFGTSMEPDVIRWPNMTLEDKLRFCRKHYVRAVYFDQNLEMQRATDVLRKTTAIYRGSFNPPTKAHLKIGGDALFEISMTNARKGELSIQNLAHRLKMLQILGKPALLTYRLPFFRDLDLYIKNIGGPKEMTYIMGVDTYNALCDRNYYSQSDTPDRCFGSLWAAKFKVHNREGTPVVRNELTSYASSLTTFFDSDAMGSSTDVRDKNNYDLVDDRITRYIKEHKLY